MLLKHQKFYKPDEWNLGHVRANAVLRAMLLFQTLKLVPVLFQHGCFHLKEKRLERNSIFALSVFFTWSFLSVEREPQLIMLSRVRSAISSRLLAAMSKLTWSSPILEACSLLFASYLLLFVDCLCRDQPFRSIGGILAQRGSGVTRSPHGACSTGCHPPPRPPRTSPTWARETGAGCFLTPVQDKNEKCQRADHSCCSINCSI